MIQVPGPRVPMPPCPRRRVLIVFVVACVMAAGIAGHTASRAAIDRQPAAPPDILLSRQLVRDAHLTIGQTVTIAADAAGTRATTFRLAGVYEPTPDPMKFMTERLEGRFHLPDLVALTSNPADPLAAESATAINIKLADPARAQAFAEDVGRRTMGLTILPTSRARQGDPFAVLERFHLAIATVTVVGSTAFLLALMVMRAEERREIVGVLRLIGISRRSILVEVVVEGALIAIGGAAIGVALAAGAQSVVNAVFQARYDTALVFVRITPAIAVRAVAVSVPAGVLAGAVASWTLLRRPTAALVRR